MSDGYQISTERVRQTGNIIGIAIVERLDRIIGSLAEVVEVALEDFTDDD